MAGRAGHLSPLRADGRHDPRLRGHPLQQGPRSRSRLGSRVAAATRTRYGNTMFFQLATSGIATGCAYALIALGFVMIWNTASVVNFAQGEFVVIAMFVALTCHVTLGWPLWM